MHERYYRACICILMFKVRGEGKDQTVWNDMLLHKYTNTILALTSFATCEEKVEHPTA